MYIKEILWLLSWPALIAVSYFIIVFALKKFETHLPDKED